MKVRKSIVVLGVIALVLALLAGCASSGGGASSGAAPIGNKTGSASATAEGFGGEVKVTITMANGIITEVEVIGDSETASIGGGAIMRAPGMIKKNNSPDFDAISGASVTSEAIIEAAKAAINQIN